MGNKSNINPNPEIKDIVKKLEMLRMKHGINKAFSDFVSFCAFAISNPVDAMHKEEREKAYLATAKAYTQQEMLLFSECFADLVIIADNFVATVGPRDILGNIMEELNMTSERSGQFFTPEHVCIMMASIVLGNPEQIINEKGYITVCEPCAGSGRMVYAMAQVLSDSHYNYCSQMVVMASDVDLRCTQMTYVQLSLYGIPAVVKHKNALTLETWSLWYTPVYILNKWCWREGFVESAEDKRENELLRLASEPMYAAMRSAFGYGCAQSEKEIIEKRENAIEKNTFSFHFDFDLRAINNSDSKQVALFS